MLSYLQLLPTDDERDKYTQLYRTYRSEMIRVAMTYVDNQDDAEDVVQESFSYILKNFEKISEVKCPKTRSYIAIVVENKSKDLLRKYQRHPEVSLGDTLEYDAIALFDDKISSSHSLAEAMKKLPKRYQDVLILRYDNDCSTEEIAEILQTSPSTVLKVISRARKALKKAYKKGNPDDVER